MSTYFSLKKFISMIKGLNILVLSSFTTLTVVRAFWCHKKVIH